MNDFDYDCLQKKRVARSAYNHVNARRGKCRLPHENLTRKELNALNGEVKTYSLQHPMSYETFMDLPEDVQKLYIYSLQDRFKANDTMVGEMWDKPSKHVGFLRRKLGIKGLPRGGGSIPTKDQRTAWEAFLRTEEAVPERKDLYAEETPVINDDNTADNTPVEETPVPVLERVITPTPVIARQLQCQITWANVHSWEELYELASKFPFPAEPGIVTLEIH
jgi:hypothetical protein